MTLIHISLKGYNPESAHNEGLLKMVKAPSEAVFDRWANEHRLTEHIDEGTEVEEMTDEEYEKLDLSDVLDVTLYEDGSFDCNPSNMPERWIEESREAVSKQTKG